MNSIGFKAIVDVLNSSELLALCRTSSLLRIPEGNLGQIYVAT